jgi:hypothetical protein
MTTQDRAPGPGQMLQFKCERTGRLRPTHLGEYRRWILYSSQVLADRWGAAPKLLKKLNSGIPFHG